MIMMHNLMFNFLLPTKTLVLAMVLARVLAQVLARVLAMVLAQALALVLARDPLHAIAELPREHQGSSGEWRRRSMSIHGR